jgi:UDP-N-acetylmuramoylalanine-D-glutamate ligase
VLTLPEAGPRIEAALLAAAGLAGAGPAGGAAAPEVLPCDDLDTAVRAGFDWARPDGIVLLSPAAPSFGTFRNYRDRGEAFGRAMRACPD